MSARRADLDESGDDWRIAAAELAATEPDIDADRAAESAYERQLWGDR